jgi:Ca-activated chloride channel family protein
VQPLTAAEAAKALGIRIYTIGAGTEGEAPFPVGTNAFSRTIYRNVLMKFDEKTLSEIATITNGQYFRATDTNSLRKIFSEIDKMEKTKIEVERTAQYRDLFQYVLIPGIACLLLEILLSQTVWRRLP